MSRNSVALLLALSVTGAAGFWAFEHFSTPPAAPAAAPGIPVTSAIAALMDVPVTLEGLGAVQAYNVVQVRSRVDGQLDRVVFKEGQEVKAGDLLAVIDPRPFRAALDQASAKRAQDQAMLTNSREDLKRYGGLVEKHYVAQQQFDTARNLVAQYEGAVQGDAAAIESARVQLDYTTIRSPIDGLVGIRQIDQGNIVHAADPGGIVVITQMRPISVVFTLPQDNLLAVLKGMAAGPLKVVALSRDGTQVLDEGRLELVDNQIDPASGTVKLKATMPNANRLLWPGQFVNARVLVDTRKRAVTVPATAVLRGQQGAYAYVIGAGGAAEVRPVVSNLSFEGLAVVDSGIVPGETVISEGQYRLQAGAKVQAAPPAPDGAKIPAPDGAKNPAPDGAK